MSCICTICARAGSKGVPNKNIIDISGLPLIAHSINQARSSGLFSEVYVSTDSEEIAAVAKNYGAVVPYIRPKELATDKAAKLPVIDHLLCFLEERGVGIDTVIDLDPTSPLRDVADIISVYDLLDSHDQVITGYLSNKNPYFNMVEVHNGRVFLSKAGTEAHTTRQESPPVYAMNASIYGWRRAAFKQSLWENESIGLHIMPHERSVDIDSEVDLALVKLLMSRKVTQ